MGKNIIITGASSGIGLETLRLFSNDKKNKIFALSRNIKNNTKLCKMKNVILYNVDLTNETEVIDCINNIFAKTNKIDILVNNAGAGIIKLIKDTSLEEWNNMFAVNATSMFLITREIIKKKANSDFLHIINISSEAGLEGFATYSAYCSAKFAVTGFSECLREEGSKSNIKVDVIYPGDVNTPFMDKCPIDKKLMNEYNIEVLDKEYMLNAIDIANHIFYLTNLPKNVCINNLKIIPSDNYKN
jgi:NADP-dependent 3-hydroxy acid dehydrogenase YdfG